MRKEKVDGVAFSSSMITNVTFINKFYKGVIVNKTIAWPE